MSAKNDFDVRIFTVNQGLSQGMVFDMLQCREGYIWVATKGGLNRYNGYSFDVFTPDAFDPFTLGASEIRKLFEDSKGRIWINHLEGIEVFIPEEGLFFHLPKPDLPIFLGWENDSSPLSFAETPDGSIWIADLHRLWRVELPHEALEKAISMGNSFPEYSIANFELSLDTVSREYVKVKHVFFSNRHGLMVGTSNGLYHLDYQTGIPTQVGLPGLSLSIAGEDDFGTIWLKVRTNEKYKSEPYFIPKVDDFYASSQIAIWDGEMEEVFDLTIRHNDLMLIESGNRIWLLQGNTLKLWNSESLKQGKSPEINWVCKEPFIQPDDFMFKSLMSDRSGLIWLGTRGYGIIKFNPQKPKFSSFLSNQTQRSVFEDPEGRLYTYINPQKLYTNPRFEKAIPNPWHLYQGGHYSPTVFDKYGNGWGNNEAGKLFQIEIHTNSLRLFDWRGFGLIYTQKGMLMSVNEEGLLQFDPEKEQTNRFPFPELQNFGARESYTRQLHESGDGTIWIFAFRGIIRATLNGDEYDFKTFHNNPVDRNSLSNDVILTVADDPLEPHRFLWVGTKGGGLNRLDKENGDIRHFTTENGLPDNVVYGLLPDGAGNLWLSTNRGLCRFHVREEITKNFTRADGLQDNEFNTGSYLKTSDGQLIFGGVNGLTVFHPDSLTFNNHQPQTRIVGLTMGNVSRTHIIPDEVQLSYKQNFISFEFAALEFTYPNQNQFRYQLVKRNRFDKYKPESWVELGNKNTIQFANLQPGRYTFQVLGSNNDGVWSEIPTTLNFSISPPWWASWWAYSIYVVLLGGAVLTFYRIQLRRNIEKQESIRLRELDEFKNRFFTNITHEFRTPLTVILGTTAQLASDTNQRNLDKDPKITRGKLNLIQRNGQNLMSLINQILDLAKLESKTLKINYIQGNVITYLHYIFESLHSLASAQDINMESIMEHSEILMDYDPERLLQIIYNLLSNAIKFTPSGGIVRMKATSDQNQLTISVEDTGIGIPKQALPHVFDRFFQVENRSEEEKFGKRNETNGTGIGLSITRDLVEVMGGTISVLSPLPDGSQGSLFTVNLPITNNYPLIESPTFTKSGSTLPSYFKGELKEKDKDAPAILIVEDNQDVSEYLANCLGSKYRLDFAYNGRTGIEKAIHSMPDLIISDVMMPEIDGFELCDGLKNDERTSHIPIVLLTAKAGIESRIAGLKRGADAYLAKPFYEEELMVWVEQLIARRQILRERYANLQVVADRGNLKPHSGEFDLEDAFVAKFKCLLEENYTNSELSVEFICSKMKMSRSQLYRKLNALTGKTVISHLNTLRLERAAVLLQTGKLNVSEVAYRVGFNDPKYFGRLFSETYGQTPSNFSFQ
ncbi:MAG: hybrid sensor histidine kinase/response regulator [Saprospirales bacterium]|nr:MAG: hybrid sensor histidine kinase/response regulator [Saprospirales bacterium]